MSILDIIHPFRFETREDCYVIDNGLWCVKFDIPHFFFAWQFFDRISGLYPNGRLPPMSLPKLWDTYDPCRQLSWTT